jgi:transcription elongation factor GreA
VQKEILLTPDHFSNLEQKLEYLTSVRRREVAERIKQSIEFGDLSENSEYDDAKNEQARLEGEILELSEILSKARLIEEGENHGGRVIVGSKVRLVDISTGETEEYQVVGSVEADPSNHKISNESPVGQAILGEKAGSTVKVQVPSGTREYRIKSVK